MYAVLVIIMICANSSIGINQQVVIDAGLALRFLRSQFIERSGLLRAATLAIPENKTIYVLNDNLLAGYALIVLGDVELGELVLRKVREYNVSSNGRVEVLLGVDIPDVFYDVVFNEIGVIDGFRIVVETRSDIIIHDWFSYSDLLVYRALDYLIEGKRELAEELFERLVDYWDGFGFRDRAYLVDERYETYKCALFIFLYRALGASGSILVERYISIHDKCLYIIKRMQDLETGGFYTHYRATDGDIIPDGDVNVETTSIVVLSLLSHYPVLIGQKCINETITEALEEVSDNSALLTVLLALVVSLVIAWSIYYAYSRHYLHRYIPIVGLCSLQYLTLHLYVYGFFYKLHNHMIKFSE